MYLLFVKQVPASLETSLIKTPVPGSSATPLGARIVYEYNPLTDELEIKHLRISDHLSSQLQRRCKNFIIEFFERFAKKACQNPYLVMNSS